ncbi:MAG: NAD-dependent epimerase/dehydratase family protein [Saonia sp.]
MRILVTGAAGFIGFHTTQKLLAKGHYVVGLDNISSYYDQNLKYDRLKELGIRKIEAQKIHTICQSVTKDNHSFSFVRMDLTSKDELTKLFESEKFDLVCNLAAQAGVRNSIENPDAYVESNIVGFLNILECCRHYHIKHLVYASSSSVYGLNKNIPFHIKDQVDQPISLYAASKKSNELMAHAYSHLFHFPTTGLRFFTVYGPWGRPDMAPFLFTSAIINNRPIKVFNKGQMERDFTYVDDIAEGVTRVVEKSVDQRVEEKEFYKLYNIGNNKAVKLMDFIKEIEINLNKEAKKEMLPLQPGDVVKTWANVDELIKDYDYSPKTSLQMGVRQYASWFKQYYGIH